MKEVGGGRREGPTVVNGVAALACVVGHDHVYAILHMDRHGWGGREGGREGGRGGGSEGGREG